MATPLELEQEEIGALVAALMLARKLNDRSFAAWLTESLPSRELSHATVINWRLHGKQPDTDFLQELLAAYEPGDPRHQFALRCLAAKSPLVWGGDGIVWKLKYPWAA